MSAKKNYIQKIIDQIITFTNLGGLPEAEEQTLREALEEQITRRLGLIIIKHLDRPGLAALGKIMDEEKPRPELLEDVFKKHMPDYAEKIKTDLDAMINEIAMALA